MEVNKSGLDDRIFQVFSETSEHRYLYLCNLQTNVSRWSKSAVDYFGLPGEYMVDASSIWENYIHPDDREIYRQDIADVFTGKKEYHDLEYRALNKEGNYVICTCKGTVLQGKHGEPDLFAGSIINHGIIDKVDATTNLYNIYEFLNTIHRLQQTKQPALVMLIGINRFSGINETYGYDFGNQVLKLFASKLTEILRNNGMVYRMDGPKFALCVHNMDIERAKILYTQIQNWARYQIIVDNAHIPVSISGGALLMDDEHQYEHSVRVCVTYAQEKSKRECHSKLVFFNNEQGSDHLKSMKLFETIRQSVLCGCQGFYLCYQPLVSARTGKITGMEALLRWRNETYGDLSPGAFIQKLEKDDCFFELGIWIIRQAISDSMDIVKEHPDFKVNVNVSYTQIDRAEFQDTLMEILQETGFPPRNLCIELTERCQTNDMNHLQSILEFFASYGIRIALDDFGTGTASLNLLRKLPITCLKIDRMFISNIQTNPTDEIIVEMVIDSANKLGINVCMEGIETEQLRDYVKKYDVGTHQGYYYSKPIQINRFKALLANCS